MLASPVAAPAVAKGNPTFLRLGAEYACIHTQRERLLEMVADFQRLVLTPDRLPDATAMLRAIFNCAGLYFSLIESILDKITAEGAARQRAEHRQILQDIDDTLSRCQSRGTRGLTEDLVHAIDGLVLREARIRDRYTRSP